MASSSAESDLAAAIGAVRSLVEDKGDDDKKKVDLSSCDSADMLDTVLRERLPSSASSQHNPGRLFNRVKVHFGQFCRQFDMTFLSSAIIFYIF